MQFTNVERKDAMEAKKDLINELGLDAQEMNADELDDEIKKAVKNYKMPSSQLLRDKLEWFSDQKFGLMIHWGLYNHLGIKESWPLVDNDWSKWQFKPGTSNAEVKTMYSQLHKAFLPLRFDPDEWADIAYSAGFRYLCFTAKHHDGFCMWDTKTTDYKVTGADVPWRSHKYADITRHLFDSFRERGMGISLYYSRADFSCPYYWEDGYAEKDGTQRIPSYDPDKKPEIWKSFQRFVYSQLEELVTNYGKIDCLWYDGGCDGVKLGLPEMTDELRKIQPDMLGVIRGGAGICEDIVTPELCFPERYLSVPWEVCTVMGKPFFEYGKKRTSFGYSYDQDYMSAKEIAHMLIDVIAKGGNLALNIAPQPDGRLPVRAVRELETLSHWMQIFSPAIHATRAENPYRDGKYAYTRTKDSGKTFVFYLYDDGELRSREYSFVIKKKVKQITDMRTSRKLNFKMSGEIITVMLPDELYGKPSDIADCFIIE